MADGIGSKNDVRLSTLSYQNPVRPNSSVTEATTPNPVVTDKVDGTVQKRSEVKETDLDANWVKKDGDTKPTTEKPTAGAPYEVKKGDTLWGILAKAGFSPKEIPTLLKQVASENGLKDPNKIQVGQKLNLPQRDRADQNKSVTDSKTAEVTSENKTADSKTDANVTEEKPGSKTEDGKVRTDVKQPAADKKTAVRKKVSLRPPTKKKPLIKNGQVSFKGIETADSRAHRTNESGLWRHLKALGYARKDLQLTSGGVNNGISTFRVEITRADDPRKGKAQTFTFERGVRTGGSGSWN